MSIAAWQRQQNFSHSHWFSGCSHWAQRYLAGPVPVAMESILACCEMGGNVTLVMLQVFVLMDVPGRARRGRFSVPYNSMQ